MVHLLAILKIISGKPGKIVSPIYGDTFPNDLYFGRSKLINFISDWNWNKYKKEGGIYDDCLRFEYKTNYECIRDYIGRARKFIFSNTQYSYSFRNEICKRAGHWGKYDGSPRIWMAERDLNVIIDDAISVKNDAKLESDKINHPIESIEPLNIISDIISELQNDPDSFYSHIAGFYE